MEKKKRRWGDRKDGVLLRDLDGMHFITPLIYPNRCDNEAYIRETIDLTNMNAYLKKKNETETEFPYTMFHLIVAALVIAGIRLHRTGLTAAAFAAGDTNPMLGNWATSAVNYAAYNFFATVGILAPLTRHLKKPGTAVWGTVLGCVLLLAVALGVLAALAVSPESVGAQLPMLDLACRLGTAGVVYAVLLFLGMFGTSVSSLVAVLTYAGQKSARLAGHRTALLLVLTAAAFAGSLFGFGDLIGTVYPVYGYLGVAAMLLVAEHAVHARRAGNHCAATGD